MASNLLTLLQQDRLFGALPLDATVVPQLPGPQKNSKEEEVRLLLKNLHLLNSEPPKGEITATQFCELAAKECRIELGKPIELGRFIERYMDYAKAYDWILDHKGNLVHHTPKPVHCVNASQFLYLLVLDVFPWLQTQSDDVVARYALIAFATQHVTDDAGAGTRAKIVLHADERKFDLLYSRLGRPIPPDILHQYLQ